MIWMFRGDRAQGSHVNDSCTSGSQAHLTPVQWRISLNAQLYGGIEGAGTAAFLHFWPLLPGAGCWVKAWSRWVPAQLHRGLQCRAWGAQRDTRVPSLGVTGLRRVEPLLPLTGPSLWALRPHTANLTPGGFVQSVWLKHIG